MEKIWLPLLFFAGVFTLVIVGIVVNYHLEKKRTEAFQKLAGELSFRFLPAGSGELLRELGHFHLFTPGHSKQMKNLMRGEAQGLEISIFDYRYVVGSGKHRQTWNQSVFLARSSGMNLPHFSMRPESIWHKIGSWFGYEDIDFESHPKFSKAYLLKGPDESAIRNLFTAETLDHFEATHGLNVEGHGDLLIFYRYARLQPDKIRDFMTEGFGVLKLFQPASE